jgi:hypothetical protein
MRNRWILVIGMAAVGLVWMGQGLGILPGRSFMNDDVRWAIAGAVILIGGVLLGWAEVRRRSRQA